MAGPTLPKRIRLIDVVTPFRASGQVSEEGLMQLVRWVRALPADGVVLWSALGSGGELDQEELEEIYTTWRAGLPPDRLIYAVSPAGGAGTPEQAYATAVAARSMGADGVVLQEDLFEKLSEKFERLDLAVILVLVDGHLCSAHIEGVSPELSKMGAVGSAAMPDVQPEMLLKALAQRGIIDPHAAFSRTGGGKYDAHSIQWWAENLP